MANCSIPNSIPGTGRTSTISLRRSKKQNSPAHSLLDASSRFIGVGRGASDVQKRREAAALQGALRARKVRGWMLDVGRWTFSFSRRVKGAWWPSRSSKPSSPRKWRGRFDSYPLRLDLSTLNAQLGPLGVERWTLFFVSIRKEVNGMSREQIRKLTSLSSCAG